MGRIGQGQDGERGYLEGVGGVEGTWGAVGGEGSEGEGGDDGILEQGKSMLIVWCSVVESGIDEASCETVEYIVANFSIFVAFGSVVDIGVESSIQCSSV